MKSLSASVHSYNVNFMVDIIEGLSTLMEFGNGLSQI